MEKTNRKSCIRTNLRFGLTLPAIAVSMFFCGTGIEAASLQDREEGLPAEDSLCNDMHAEGKRFAVTAISANCLREEPDFAAELGNQLLMGTPVTIADSSGYWRQVVSPDPYKAWCADKSLTEMDREGLERYIAAPKYIFTGWYGHLYESPDEDSGRISDLVAGDLLTATNPVGNNGPAASGCRKDRTHKFIKKGKFIKVWLPSGKPGYVLKKNVEAFFPVNASEDSLSASGSLPEPEMKEEMLRRIALLEPGDLIFFGTKGKDRVRITHVGIYAGGGRFIHASGTVRWGSLIPGDEDYYDLSYKMIAARRVIGEEDTGSGVVSILHSPAYFPQD